MKEFLNKSIPFMSALLFFMLIYFFFPFRERLQFDPDEGLNLIRAFMVNLNYGLYSQVSSDQPPLFTYILVLLFKLNGFDVNVARIIVLLFSSLMIWSCSKMVQIIWGNLAALLFFPIILLTPRIIRLSVSVMIGLPSISLACISFLFLIFWHKNNQYKWLIFSGIFLALSICIKLFTIYLIPIFIGGIYLSVFITNQKEDKFKNIFTPILIWGVSFSFTAAMVLMLFVGPQNLVQIIFPHVNAYETKTFEDKIFSLKIQIKESIPLIAFSLFGVLSIFSRRNWLSLYFLAWVLLTFILLSFHRPIFYHHQVLITVPAAMLAAAGTAEGFIALSNFKKYLKSERFLLFSGLFTLLFFIGIICIYFPVPLEDNFGKTKMPGYPFIVSQGKIELMQSMTKYKDQTNWILTDVPIFSFLLNKPIPPILATFSLKRLETGSLTPDDILTAAKNYKPEQIMMGRFNIPILNEYIFRNYTLVASPEVFKLFIRNDLVK